MSVDKDVDIEFSARELLISLVFFTVLSIQIVTLCLCCGNYNRKLTITLGRSYPILISEKLSKEWVCNWKIHIFRAFLSPYHPYSFVDIKFRNLRKKIVFSWIRKFVDPLQLIHCLRKMYLVIDVSWNPSFVI